MSYDVIKSICKNRFSPPGACISGSILNEYNIEIRTNDIDTEYILPFCGDDNKTNFEKNLKKQSTDWYYRTHDIKYTLNSSGYRTKQFDKINWEESIVIFGCSSVFGIGVTDEHTVPYFLEQISGRPVVNMGIPGASNQLITHNNIILSDSKYPIPKVVINSWTGLNRYVLYDKNNINCMGPWRKEHDKKYQPSSLYSESYNRVSEFEDPLNLMPFSLMNIKICRNIWKNKTIYGEYCAWDSMEDIIQKIDDNFKLIQINRRLDWTYSGNDIDKSYLGRDFVHRGHIINKATAEILFENIKPQLENS